MKIFLFLFIILGAVGFGFFAMGSYTEAFFLALAAIVSAIVGAQDE